GGVKQEAVPLLLDGHLPDDSQMLSKDPSSMVAVQRFFHLMLSINARPRTHIFYMREAYVSDDDEVRVTMDRDVFSEPNLNSSIKVKMAQPVHSYKGMVILELKFTNRFPNWFRELVRVSDAMQCGAAKYVSGVTELGRSRLRANGAVMEEPSLLANYQPGDDLPTFARQDTGVPWSLLPKKGQ
ncbi:MAG TPA: VTC domain-containing protein, partial [Candidatus Saccharimonadales bacterium]|nr:VTC domain-containing protein [Candidatus Saccharimonadales bacterium]